MSAPMPAEWVQPMSDDELEGYLAWIVEVADGADIDPADLAAELAKGEPVPGGPWRPTDDGGAEWSARMLAGARADLAQLQEQHRAWAGQVEAWWRSVSRPLTARVRFFEGHLEQYAFERRAATNEKQKSVKLPSATVNTTGHQPKIEVADEDVLVAWIDANLEGAARWDSLKRTVRISELRKALEIAPMRTGRYVLALSCDHELVTADFDETSVDAALPDLPRLLCPLCEVDVEITAASHEVIAVAALPIPDEDGAKTYLPVPGTAVSPVTVSASIKLTS